jgi:AraC-like DNA-binding protein
MTVQRDDHSTRASAGYSALLLRPLAQVLARLDVDPTRFLRDVGVTDATREDEFVPVANVDDALLAIATARADESFGLTLARAIVRPLGLFGHLVWLSGTLRDALLRAARFYSLVTGRATLTLDEPKGATLATLTRHQLGGGHGGRILTEFSFASSVLRARSATEGRFHVRAMRFTHEPSDPRPYEALFEAPMAFGASEDQLVLDVAELDLPLASADPITAAAIEAQATQMIPRGGHVPLGDRVRRAAAELLASDPSLPSLPAIARRVGVGERALRRRLAREGSVTLRAIVESVRRARASELLASGHAVKEVAFLLGFSEPSAFSRAYKRWTGETPSTRRA